MPLLSLYINNKAGGLIYHKVKNHRRARTRASNVSLTLDVHLARGRISRRMQPSLT